MRLQLSTPHENKFWQDRPLTSIHDSLTDPSWFIRPNDNLYQDSSAFVQGNEILTGGYPRSPKVFAIKQQLKHTSTVPSLHFHKLR